jgi:NAD(P)-dependent dehydrogenase (short-subunit alcohol dehydrogenase family)
MDFTDKVVIVTGASGGIGAEVVRGFARRGARVALCDIAEDRIREESARINADGGKAAFFRMDVCRRADVEDMIQKIGKQWGAPDILVNAAGIITRNGFFEDGDEDWDRVMAVNLKGTWICSQTAARAMVASGKRGAIVNLGSVNSEVSDERQVIYAASKGGVRTLTKGMAIALAPHGIRVNAVGPATIVTEINRQFLVDHPEELQRRLRRIPLGRVGTPEDVVGGVLYLASDMAGFVTGAILFMDGGRLSQNNA